jgi:CelD/BcsL family acetyltransferase involved in cellulose biosynthesis
MHASNKPDTGATMTDGVSGGHSQAGLTGPAPAYALRVIETREDLGALKKTWDALAQKHSYAPFLSSDWFEMWIEHFLADGRLHVLALEREGIVEGIAPFMLKKERYKGIRINKVELMGNVYSPVRYFLFRNPDDERRREALFHIFRYFREDFKQWDVMDLHAIPEENNDFLVVCDTSSKCNYSTLTYGCFRNMYLTGIDYSGEQYWAERPKSIRKDASYQTRRLEKSGNLEFRVVTRGGELDTYMDIYYNLYALSWQERERVGPTFHRDLAEVAARNGWLRLGFLFLDDEPISCQFWISAYRRAYILKTFYDRKFHSYSPGKILTLEMARYVIDIDEVHTIDYLHGDEEYKRAWTPDIRERKGIIVFNNTAKGNFLSLLMRYVLPAVNGNRYSRAAKNSLRMRLSREERV